MNTATDILTARTATRWRAPSLHRVFEFWCRQCGDAALPSIDAFSLLDLPHALANTTVLDVRDPAGIAQAARAVTAHDLVFSHIGSNVVMRYRRDLTGRSAAEIRAATLTREPLLDVMFQALETRDAVLTVLPAIGTPLPELDLLVLPLADTAGHPARLVLASQIVGRPVIMPPQA